MARLLYQELAARNVEICGRMLTCLSALWLLQALITQASGSKGYA